MNELLEKQHEGIQGVMLIDSGKEGPILGISACTHGGETVGLDVIDFLLKQVNIETSIKKGKIYFILSNIKAYQKSLELKNFGDPDYIINARYVDENMNRCCSVESLNNPISYERQRANELTDVLKTLDYHFDIHSTMNPSGSMLIHTEKSANIFGDIFNTDEVYIKLPETVVGKPFVDITQRNGGIGIGIETGNQTNKDGYKVGVDNILRLLSKLEMIEEGSIDKSLILTIKANKTFDVIGSIFIENDSFQPVKDFNNQDFVRKGEVIAHQGDKLICAPDDCYIIMPSNKHSGEEYCFLAKRII